MSSTQADLAQIGDVLLVGAGKMGGAMLRGWLARGLTSAQLSVVDPHPSDELASLARHHGFALNPDLRNRRAPAVMIVAVKPQMLASVAPAFAGLTLADTVLVSIMAGKTIADLTAQFSVAAVVRAMPNTPAAIGRGITGAFANAAVEPRQRAAVQALLSAVGHVEWLASEDQIDAVTAVSGSGPAYVFFLAECLAEAGRAAGLDAGVAERFARATVEGAGALMTAEPGVGADQLRRNVTSPGGTTAAALAVLGEHDALKTLMIRAVEAARRRAGELAG